MTGPYWAGRFYGEGDGSGVDDYLDLALNRAARTAAEMAHLQRVDSEEHAST
jgi:hypothetical protein